METAAPTKFGKYDVVGVLGKGAMGIVYDCRDPVIGRRVAIKTVLKESLDSSEAEGLLGRFKQEAQAAGRLNHPGVVSIYDYGETADVAFIAMEYISGKELKSYFDKGEKFALADTVRIMSAILEALEHAHVSKVVHRDIKPANIMITDDGRVKVADFGVAKIESSLATQIGTRVGTPAYMAPEQHRMMAVDGRADLFSCGVILYQFLTHGARPFTGGSQTIARNILTQTPTPPSQINVELLPVWDLLVKKALAKRADERYQSAREFIDALRRAVGDLPGVPAAPPSSAEDASKGASRPPVEPAALSRAATTTNSGRPERTDLAMESELEFWKEIKDSDHPDDFAAFIDSFPDGRFSHLAKRRLDKLKRAGGSAPNSEDQTELSAGHTVAKLVPGAASPGSSDAPANQAPQQPPQQAPEPLERGTEQASAERARKQAEQQAEQQAQQDAEARQREAEAREREEAEQQARRAAAELAEREARARTQQEAEERRQQALERESARIAAEQAQQQEQAKRDAEAARLLELEAQKRQEAEEKALKLAQERRALEEEQRQRERDAVAKREAEAKAKRDAKEQERQKKEAAATAAKEAQAAKELAERKQREAAKEAREAEERARKEAQAQRVAGDLAKASQAKANQPNAKAGPGPAHLEREAAEKSQRSAPVAQADADATVIRKAAPDASAPQSGDRSAAKAAAKDAAGLPSFDPDATAIRHVDADATLLGAGAAPGRDAAPDVDIDLTENAPAHYLKDVRTEAAKAPQPTASVALKVPGAPGVPGTQGKPGVPGAPLATPLATPAATPATNTGADAIRVQPALAQAAASGRSAVSATVRAADDADAAQVLPVAQKKPVFLVAGVAAAVVAAGVGWFLLTPAPAPSGGASTQAGAEGKSAKDQASAQVQAQSKAPAVKAVPEGASPKSGAPATAEVQKSREAAEQKKAEQEAQNRAAEKAAADKVAADKAAADKSTAEKLAAAKSATEKAAITKLAAEKAAADKLAAEKLAAAKSAADKAAADKLAADRAAADKLAADKAAADKLAADKAAADRVAADKAAADKAASDKAAADRAASAVAAAGSIADRIAAATSPPELYKRAVALRNEGKTSQAVPLLRQASSQGHGPSSRLLAVIFKDGAPDVRADFRQAERFQALGESQGDR